MEEYGDSKDKRYPRGRGYGNDYMRGGEIFGGYGYQERADYDRPRGEGRKEGEETANGSTEVDNAGHPSAPENAPDGKDGLDAGGDDRDGVVKRFPQDARAGGWNVPHDFADDPGSATQRSATPLAEPTDPPTTASRDGSATTSLAESPKPKIEHTFGETGGTLSHSRSYYVTQAQLQQRRYVKE